MAEDNREIAFEEDNKGETAESIFDAQDEDRSKPEDADVLLMTPVSAGYRLNKECRNLPPNSNYDLSLQHNGLMIRQHAGDKAQLLIPFESINDIFYGRKAEAAADEGRPLGKALGSGELFEAENDEEVTDKDMVLAISLSDDKGSDIISFRANSPSPHHKLLFGTLMQLTGANHDEGSKNAKTIKLRTCEKCGERYPASAKLCPYCNSKKPAYKKPGMWIMIGILVLSCASPFL